VLSLLACSCQLMTEDYDAAACSDPAQYINITIAVRSGNSLLTRSTPNGGEDGDGREQGIDTRENEVEGVTLVFYRNADGINAPAESAAGTPVDFVAYYPTSRDDGYTPRTGTHYADEVYYTTGDQAMPVALATDETYHVLVIANADLTSRITTGSTLADVRDLCYSEALYTGTNVSDASKFVMTSADDNVLTFDTYTEDKALNRLTYQFDNIHIERMAARIDFWADGGSYDAATYDHAGYVYDVAGSTDKFVLTSVEPFNLNGGQEYLFKRTNDAAPYLADETTLNWVADCNAGPDNAGKTKAEFPAYIASGSTIAAVAAKSGALGVATTDGHSRQFTVDGKENFIVAYAKENTILPLTPYYYYASGLAFEGYYYKNGATTGGERRVYYHFIRHQGELTGSYTALSAAALSAADKAATLGSSAPAMNLGIVRNNIYRISVGTIQAEEGDVKVTLNIKVKKWDRFEHDTIYM